MTGGINKLEFQIKYQQLCRKHIAEQYAIVMMDSVDFKIVNRNLGAKNGDNCFAIFML